MPTESQNGNDENAADEWTIMQKPTRRRRPQRRRNPNLNDVHGASPKQKKHDAVVATNSRSHKSKDASIFFEKAVAAQLQTTVDVSDSVTPEQIETALEICLRELKGSQYWETVRRVLKVRADTQHPLRSIVCYGIGNFGTKRPSAPLWQLALALLIRDYVDTTAFIINSSDSEGQNQTAAHQSQSESTSAEIIPRQRTVAMHYFEPLMTTPESEILKKLGVQIIEENERGKRSVNNDGEIKKLTTTLFFMPHCPMSLYTNLFHTNWDFLQQIIIFGNSLSNYIDGENTNIVSDPQKKQALEILEVLQPFWEMKRLKMNKKDVSDMSAYFEQAFNDSSFTSFAVTKNNSITTGADGWSMRPQLDLLTEYNGEGEVL